MHACLPRHSSRVRQAGVRALGRSSAGRRRRASSTSCCPASVASTASTTRSIWATPACMRAATRGASEQPGQQSLCIAAAQPLVLAQPTAAALGSPSRLRPASSGARRSPCGTHPATSSALPAARPAAISDASADWLRAAARAGGTRVRRRERACATAAAAGASVCCCGAPGALDGAAVDEPQRGGIALRIRQQPAQHSASVGACSDGEAGAVRCCPAPHTPVTVRCKQPSHVFAVAGVVGTAHGLHPQRLRAGHAGALLLLLLVRQLPPRGLERHHGAALQPCERRWQRRHRRVLYVLLLRRHVAAAVLARALPEQLAVAATMGEKRECKCE